MRDANSNTPAGRPGRSQRPGFRYQIRLVGGEAGRRLEREQTEAIAEVLGWLAAHPDPVTVAAARAVPRAGSGPVRPVPNEAVPRPEQVGWPNALEVRARAVGLVGVGRPIREVARLVRVHPATVRRWVRQAAGRWADLADAADAGE